MIFISISTKKISIIMLSTAVALSCVTIVLSIYFNRSSQKVNIAAQTSTKIEYILKDYNGHLAVFYAGKTTPYEEFDILTNSFSDYDKNLLQKGIYAYSQSDIQRLIEDYTS